MLRLFSYCLKTVCSNDWICLVFSNLMPLLYLVSWYHWDIFSTWLKLQSCRVNYRVSYFWFSLMLCKICQNTGFLWPIFSRVIAELWILYLYGNTGQRKPVFSHILYSVESFSVWLSLPQHDDILFQSLSTTFWLMIGVTHWPLKVLHIIFAIVPGLLSTVSFNLI